MNLHEIYEQLRQRHMTTSLRGFSRSWLGRAPNYACTHATELPLQAGIKLYRNLRAYRQDDLAEMVLATLVGDDPAKAK